MFPPEGQTGANPDPKTYPLGENIARPVNGKAGALVALSHTPLERQLYEAMLLATGPPAKGSQLFTVRRLMEITEITSHSAIRRGLAGLVAKLSVEREPRLGKNSLRDHAMAYRVFTPEVVIARRSERGIRTYDNRGEERIGHRTFERVIRRVVENRNLSRREAQVALCCAEGLTNAQIGFRLSVTEQTVKFHLRNVFVKFRVKRRAELISQLLR